MLVRPLLASKFVNLHCHWCAVKCIVSGFCTGQGCLLAQAKSVFYLFLIASRGNVEKTKQRDLPKRFSFPSIPSYIIFLSHSMQCHPKEKYHPHCSGLLSDSLHLSRWPRKLDLAQVTWKCGEDSKLPVICGWAPGHSDLMYYFPQGRNYVSVMTSSLNV